MPLGRATILSELLLQNDRVDARQWQKLHSEIRQFYLLGILFPIVNDKLSGGEHYCNHNMDPIRIIPLLLYDRIIALSYSSKQRLLPDTGGRYTIKSRPPNAKQAWKCNTEYMRKRYDRWYWEMRTKRTPFTVALRTPMKHLKSNIQRKVHFHHVDMAVERNCRLTGPPNWLCDEYRC